METGKSRTTLDLCSNRMDDGKIDEEDVGTSLAATTLHAHESPEESPGANTTCEKVETVPLDEKVEKSSSTPGNSSELVSAMKGGRAQKGITSMKSEELHVKWAPEVRDPPTTSMSHTVRNHHHHYQRPKGKKNSSKHKKNKSPRGGGSKSLGKIPDYIPPLNLRLQVTGKGGLVLDGYNAKHSVEVYAAAGGQQDKCRGNFLREEGLAAAKVQHPIAEAL